MFAKTLTFLGLASAASAHIVMTNPVPLGNPNNSPLEASGADFPCKGPVTGGPSTDNVYAQGSTQQLAFMGTAVHGGGSCQVSVTTDLNPTKDSVWKVIKSIEGGCPAQNTEGNLGSDASAPVPYKYDFTIPEDLASGDYVFAWSWFNKVGNREMYMNCAAVSITGSGGSDGFLDTLPDMFVANVGNGCGTEHGTDVKFPNPGKALERLNGATEAFAAPTGSCGASGPAPEPEPTTPPTQPEDPAPTTPPTQPEDPAPEPTSVTTPDSPAPTVPGGIFITVTTTGGSSEPTGAPETPEQPAPEQPSPQPEQPTPEPEQPTTPDTPSGAQTPGTACSDEGAWNCVGGNSFQRCASGAWSAVLDLAAGMNCESGVSSQLKVSSQPSKRSMRRSQRINA